jgi:hypothetical protein
MQLSELKAGLALVGLEPELVCTVVAVNAIADGAVQVFYKQPDGTLRERLLGTVDEATIALATTERPWAFDGDAAAFELACEANRIDLAFLFDPMMAVHTSNVDPRRRGHAPQCGDDMQRTSEKARQERLNPCRCNALTFRTGKRLAL